MADASVQGRFLWEGLLTADPAAATAFYGRVIGWTAAPWEAHPSQTLFHAGSGPVAGLMALTEQMRAQGARGRWLSYIGTDDVDATVARAQALGARVSSAATDLPDVGRVATLVDPHGASFGLFKPNQPSAPRGVPHPGEAAWHELMTPDPEASLRFYSELFGWELINRMDMGPIGFYYIFGSGGTQLGGMFKPSKALPGPGSAWVLYVAVPDADAAAAAATQAGGQLHNGPMDVPGGGRIAQLADPHGVMFAVHSMKAPEASRQAAASASAAAPKPAAPRKPRAPKPTPAAPPPAAAPEAAPASRPPARPAAQPPARAVATPKPVPAPTAKPAPAAKPAPEAKATPKATPKPAAAQSARKKKAAPAKAKVKAKAKAKARPAVKPKAKAKAKAKSKPAKRVAPSSRRAAAARKVARPSAAERKRQEKARRKAEKAEKAEKARRKKEKKERKKRKKDKKGRRKK